MSRAGKKRGAGRTWGCEATKVALVSLGCPKNLVDSEAMAELLDSEGFAPAPSVDKADLVIVNTCTFVREATEESAEKLREILALKEAGLVRNVIAAGCLVQRLGEGILARFPGLDGAVGTGSWHRIVEACRDALSGGNRAVSLDPPGRSTPVPRRRRSSCGHYAYLKVTEGCHRRCSYCLIPKLRGELRSVPAGELVDQARALADSGVTELILVGEDIGAYGNDLGSQWDLPRLLETLAGVEGVNWIRMLYVHPASVNERLVKTAEDCGKVCAYIDVPVQHASDRILSRMERPTTRRDLERVMSLLRSSAKSFAVRTTVMVGFPGERREDFEELMEFLRAWEFDHLGAFCYSAELGTKAAEYPDRVDTRVSRERRLELMELQRSISRKRNSSRLGERTTVVVDAVGDAGLLVGRTQRQAPDIDGVTLVRGGGRPGEYLSVEITGAGDYDLEGRVASEDGSG